MSEPFPSPRRSAGHSPSKGATHEAHSPLTGADLKNGTVGEKQVGKSTLLGGDIKDGSLGARDVKAGSLTADRFAGGQLTKPTRWVLVNRAGQIEAQSGGFSVTAAYPTSSTPAPPGGANGNVYINAGEDLSDNGIAATIALENGYDLNGDGVMTGTSPTPDNNPEFAGEISTSKCAIPGVVTCAPTGTNNVNHFVVSPRESDGTRTSGANRKKFYVVITG